MAQMAPTIRPLRTGDIPELPGINPSFATHEELALTREQFDLKRITWVLSQKRLDVPFDRGDRYDLGEEDLRAITERLRSGKCLQLVAETNGHIIGLLEVEPSSWRAVGWIWNVLVDSEHRRRGLGRGFIERASAWGRQRGLWALVAEAKTNNVAACRFYSAMGFVAGGVDDHYYRYCHDPRAAEEVAIFWYLELRGPADRVTAV
jgi:GNAT superfamily N-acetyltransferase